MDQDGHNLGTRAGALERGRPDQIASGHGGPPLAIEIKGLRKIYAGGRRMRPMEALKGIDLEVPRGSVFGLLGPNG
ncbi:MAG TPA: hypothetical protein VHQ91_00850, partial [Geminicoccaceae bacterium]|nr:hypothetical protein [Geminicoccaceae bacterium]